MLFTFSVESSLLGSHSFIHSFIHSLIHYPVSHCTMTAAGGPVVECLPGVQEVMGSIPGWVIPKTLKMVLDASLLSAWHLKDRSRHMVGFTSCRL